jgi:general secretion pathway protein G
MTSPPRPDRESGFTILELIIVVAIIGILASIAMPALKPAPTKAKEAVLRTNLVSIRDALDQHYADNGHYPPSLEALVDDGYLRDVPRDPITRSTETWEVEYDEPAEGAAETDLGEGGEPGIFDVHSGSELEATDGTLYSEW